MAKRAPDKDLPIVIVGAGFAGMCMAIELERAGIDSYVILEADEEIGGTWRDNTYPGCACDIPSHLYSYSFELNPNWSCTYSPQPEIQDYLLRCAEKYDLYKKIRFNTEIREAHFDESTHAWTLASDKGETFEARAVVLGVGPLSRPNIPDIEGLADFEGAAFHSAQWDHDFDLKGKKVGVIGTGASAIQIVPAIAEEVDELVVFQRTPPWVMPRSQRTYSELEKKLFATIPGLQRLYRSLIYWRNEAFAVGFVTEKRIMRIFEWMAKRYIRSVFDDPQMRHWVTPDYSIGCKRVTLTDKYYPALARPNVELVPHAVELFTPEGVVAKDGSHRQLDAVVLATGFHATDFLSYFDVTGRDGRDLNQAWREGAEAYYGVAVSGFPNLFMLVGPNTGLGHNSIVFMIESQVNLVRQCIETLLNENLPSLEVRPAVHRRFNETLQQRMKDTVWQSGCQSWYQEESGKNTTLWPGYTFEYWLRTKRFNPDDFRMNW